MNTHDEKRITRPDPMGLGRSSGQRTAEVIAGLRAEQMPSPETAALSTQIGRSFGKIMGNLSFSQQLMRFVSYRTQALSNAARRVLIDHSENALLLEIGAGFSPRGLYLAREFPSVQVLEIDLPEVIHEKQRRLRRAHLVIPPNLTFRDADLLTVNLADLLEGRQATVVIAEGLSLYLTPQENLHVNRHVRGIVAAHGVFLLDLYPQHALDQIIERSGALMLFFSRQGARFKGVLPDKATAQQWFNEAGYSRLEIYPIAEMIEGGADLAIDDPFWIGAAYV